MRFADSQILIYIAIFVVWILSIRASFIAVKRKNLSYIWVLFTCIFTPIFYVVECFPNKSLKEVKLIECEACQNNIASISKVCLHCGHPNKLYKKPSATWYEWGVGILIGVVFIWSIIYPPSLSLNGLPTCNSYYAQNSVKEIFKTIPMIKMFNLSLVQMNDIETVEQKGLLKQYAEPLLF